MSEIEPEANASQYTGWDALITALLGAALLAAGWLDLRAYLAHLGKPRPEFSFLEPTNGEQTGDNEQYRHADAVVWLDNIGRLETLRHGRIRHGFGPRTAVLVWTHRTHALLNLRYFNGIDDQTLTISCDGQVIEQFPHLPTGYIERRYPLNLHPGANEIDFAFARYNHGGVEYTHDDPRPMAGEFHGFDLTLY